jgi:hypothetical protein
MANLSVRGLDAVDLDALKKQAASLNASVNSLVLQLITQGLGRQPHSAKRKRFDDLDALAGSWQKKEAVQFERAIAPFSKIDEELWK